MKLSFLYSLFFVCLFFFACSSEYDYSVNVDTENIAYISLESNLEGSKIGVNQTLDLSVINDENNADLTEASTFYVNDEAIFGNEYSFQEIGTYTIYGEINNIKTDILTIEVVDESYIIVSHKKALKGQEISFKLVDTNGQDMTTSTSFAVNGEAITGNTFSSNEEGVFTITTENVAVAAESFEVFIPKRKITIEDYTGSWCGWCPRVLLVVEELEELTDDIVVLAVHVNDEMEFPERDILLNAFNVPSALPKIRVNRTENVNVNQDADIPIAVDYIKNMAGVGTNSSIAIKSKLQDSKLRVEVDLLSTTNIPSNYKLAVYLYQDNLVYDQTNYYTNTEGSPYYQMGNPIPDFVHNHVLEASLTDNVLGRELSNSVQPYTIHNEVIGTIDLSAYTHNDNGNSFDTANFGIAVFLVDENNNAVNAQSVKAGENVGFE